MNVSSHALTVLGSSAPFLFVFAYFFFCSFSFAPLLSLKCPFFLPFFSDPRFTLFSLPVRRCRSISNSFFAIPLFANTSLSFSRLTPTSRFVYTCMFVYVMLYSIGLAVRACVCLVVPLPPLLFSRFFGHALRFVPCSPSSPDFVFLLFVPLFPVVFFKRELAFSCFPLFSMPLLFFSLGRLSSSLTVCVCFGARASASFLLGCYFFSYFRFFP